MTYFTQEHVQWLVNELVIISTNVGGRAHDCIKMKIYSSSVSVCTAVLILTVTRYISILALSQNGGILTHKMLSPAAKKDYS